MNGSGLRNRVAGNGLVELTERGWRLRLHEVAGQTYQLAQIDDYWGKSRRHLPWRSPATLQLRARASSADAHGTWGFGFWNDPFGLALGPTKETGRFPTVPQCAWFFYASGRSYLSLREAMPANGFMAQVFHGRRPGPWLARAGLAYPFSRRRARRILSQNISEDAAPVRTDPRDWHAYEIRLMPDATRFSVDGVELLTSPVFPEPPLSLVVWIDNQYAAFDPQGNLAWGVDHDAEDVTLEIEDLACNMPVGPLTDQSRPEANRGQ